MAGKFMRIRKVVIPFMSLVILVSQLTGCAALSSKELVEELDKSPEVVLEVPELDPSASSTNPSTITVGDQQFTVDTQTPQTSNEQEDPAVGIVEDGQQQVEKEELAGDALTGYFQQAYDTGVIIEGDVEAKIAFELESLQSLVNASSDKKLPADYESQYRAWRPVEQAPEIQLFVEVNEVVYTTNNVNIRASWSASSEKLGSLSRGQSVTRTGTSIAGTEAKGWSRVTLSDGRTAYISNQYLSLTKPTQQTISQPSTGTQGGGTQTTTPPSTGSQGSTGQTQTPPSTGGNPFGDISGGGQSSTGNPELDAIFNGTTPDLSKRPGATQDENGNWTIPDMNVQ